jgi:putative solute:sodium symporter small subunit
MRKIDKEKADAFFKEKNRYTFIYLVVWFLASYAVVLFAEFFANFTFNGFPFHYYMGAQGSIVIFIILLFINAVASDKLEQKYGIQQSKKQTVSNTKTLD